MTSTEHVELLIYIYARIGLFTLLSITPTSVTVITSGLLERGCQIFRAPDHKCLG